MDFKDQYNYESRNINLFNDIKYVKKKSTKTLIMNEESGLFCQINLGDT